MDGDSTFRFSPRANRAHEIAWRAWGEEAFAEAHRLGRPVLLSLSAVWCHWCHVMDETTYSDERVIAAINEHFVPIRVDNDRHPDVNRRYNMGGWPTTAFLTANGEPVTGATYLPPDQMVESLARVRAFFEANRTALLALETAEHAHAADGDAALAHLGGAPSRTRASEADFEGDPDVPGDIPAEVCLQVVRAFDPMHGGLGADPKFPQADVFAFVVAYAGMRGAGGPLHVEPHTSGLLTPARVNEVVGTTLEAMAAGDICDAVGGGFFRYATQRDWSVPHYEKMLEENARLGTLYLEAALVARSQGDGLGDPDRYRDAAAGTIDYLLGALWRNDPPSFGGSQDADERYYSLDAEGRASLPAPFVDPTVYVDWNALAARLLLRGGPLLGRSGLTACGESVLEHLWLYGRRDGAMVHYLTPSGEQGAGAPLLVDQAAVTGALLDAYEVTGARKWLERAQTLVEWVCRELRAADGRLHDRLVVRGDGAGLLARPVTVLDENAAVADALLRLEAYTGEAEPRERARDLLVAWATSYEQYGVAAAPYAQALLRYLERPEHIVVVGPRDAEATKALHAAALASPRPLRTVQLLDPADPADAARLAQTGFLPAEAPAAYACAGTVCRPPERDPARLGRPLV